MDNNYELSIEKTSKLKKQSKLKKVEVTKNTSTEGSSTSKRTNEKKTDFKKKNEKNNFRDTANDKSNSNDTEPSKMITRSKRNIINTNESKHENENGRKNENKNESKGESKGESKNENKGESTYKKKNEKNNENKQESKSKDGLKPPSGKMTTRNSKRIAEKTENVKTISESYNGDVNDVENWVKKTKDIINQKLAPKALYSDEENEAKEKEETKNHSKRGRKKKEITINKLKVEHKSEDVKEEMILTLKDKNILEEDEEADCLINQELETHNNKNDLHKNDENYWNKNYYDPLASYNENATQENDDHFHMPSKYGKEKQFFEVEVTHEKEEEKEEQEQTEKKAIEKKGEQNNASGKTEEESLEKENKKEEETETETETVQLQNKPPGKKRGRKKKQVENEPKQEISQEENISTKTDCFVQLKKRKTNNISKRKKEDRWGFLFDNDKEEKKKEPLKKSAKEGEEEEEKKEKEKEKKENGPMAKSTKEEEEHSKKKHKEKKLEREKEIEKIKERGSEAVADEIVKVLLEDPSDLSFDLGFDLGFDRFGDASEDAEEVYTLLEKVAELKKKKRENRQKRNLEKYVVVNEGKKGNNDESKNQTRNTTEDPTEKDVQNEIIKLTETSEFCRNILLSTDLCASDSEEILRSVRKKETTKNSKNKKDVEKEKKGTSSILKEQINENILKNAQLEDEKREKEEEEEEEEEDGEKKGKEKERPNEKKKDLKGVSKIFNEVKLDQGLFGALTYLKAKGELNMEEKIYRNPENRPLHMPTDKDSIKLDYKNESGKVMTPKETFRHISWIFHGKKQGKNKLEKKIKRMEMERRFKENPIDSLPTLNVLKQYQETKKKAYFTLSNKM